MTKGADKNGWVKDPNIYILARSMFIKELRDMGLNWSEILGIIYGNREELKNLERH